MRKYSTNLAFADLNMNLLLGFVTLFILAFLMINPVSDEGKIDPDGLVMVTMTWPSDSIRDMDLWMRGPDGSIVSYRFKDKRYMILDRDDLGRSNDVIIVNGVVKVIQRNIETIMVTDLQDGEYVINAHHFSAAAGETVVTVEVIGLFPYHIWFSGDATLTARNEVTLVSFIVEGGRIVDTRTDIQIPLIARGGSANG